MAEHNLHWYPREIVGIRIKGAGEDGHPTLSEVHPNLFAEAVRWSICEAGLIQAIGRGRAVNRTAANPLQIDVIGKIPLPLEVHEVMAEDAKEPDPHMVMAARGLVVSEMATKGKWEIISKMLPDLFDTADAARMALKRTKPTYIYKEAFVRLSSFISATVKLKDARYAVPVQIDSRRGDPREVAERLLGPLAAFKVLPVASEKAVITDDVGLATANPVTYLEPPLNPTPSLPPPADPEPMSLAVANSPEPVLPEPAGYGAELDIPQSPSISFEAIVDWVTGGGIPEDQDWIEATRIWAERSRNSPHSNYSSCCDQLSTTSMI
jgi:hypothetical protein